MGRFCSKCMTGPVGIAGHDSLLVETIGAGVMRFRCGECAASWTRSLKLDPRNPTIWTGPFSATSGRAVLLGTSLPRSTPSTY